MSKENWIKISLKSDWKKRVLKKQKCILWMQKTKIWWTKFSTICIVLIECFELINQHRFFIFVFVFEKTLTMKKKSRNRKHQKSQYHNAIWRIFIIVTNKYHNRNAKLRLHIDHWLFNLFLSMTSSF